MTLAQQRPAAIIGLESASAPVQDAIAAAGGDAIDMTDFPVLCAHCGH